MTRALPSGRYFVEILNESVPIARFETRIEGGTFALFDAPVYGTQMAMWGSILAEGRAGSSWKLRMDCHVGHDSSSDAIKACKGLSEADLPAKQPEERSWLFGREGSPWKVRMAFVEPVAATET